MVEIRCLKNDINLGLLGLIILALSVFAISSMYYSSSIQEMQQDYEEKIAKLDEIEQQLIAQEEQLQELQILKGLMEEDRESLEDNLLSMKTEYQTLRIEKTSLEAELDAKPFSKTLCKAAGNARCQT